MTPSEKPTNRPDQDRGDEPEGEERTSPPSGRLPLRSPSSLAGAPSGEVLAEARRSPADPFIGKVLDHRYRLVHLIARGGMGRVYRAEQAPLHRIVAVKILDGASEHDQEFRDRFIREAGACARLTHPNTIRIFDYGNTWDDIHYIAMEHLDGRNLHAVIRAEAPMAPARVVHIAHQICGSLREAHQLGLIHRDLKPSNIMLTADGGGPEFVKVLDFGLVKELRGHDEITRADAVVGSPSYMSPEQIRAAPVDQRSDLYSLGILLYACLTGRTPFTGANSVNVLMAHLTSPVPPIREANPHAECGPVLEWVLRTCLAKEPADRFASVDELRRALALAAAEAAGQVVPTPHLVDGQLVIPESAGWTPPSGARQPLIAPAAEPRVNAHLPEESLPLEPSRSRTMVLSWSLLLLGLGMGAALFLGLVGWLAWRGVSAPAAVAPAAVAPPDVPVAVPAAASTVKPEEPVEQASMGSDAPPAMVPTSATPSLPAAPPKKGAASRPAATAAPSAPASAPAAASASAAPAAPVPAAPAPGTPAPEVPASTAPTAESPGSTNTRATDLRDPWKGR